MKKRRRSSRPSQNKGPRRSAAEAAREAAAPDAGRAKGPASLPAFPEGRRAVPLACLVIAALTLLAFSSILDNELINWDDPAYLDNHLIKSLSWQNIKTIFSTFHTRFFSQPMVLLSFAAEYRFFGHNPTVYHLTNLLLHTANSLLVLFIARLVSRRIAVAFIAAALFAVHPLHVESVAWMAERKDVLSGFFFLSSILFYLMYRKGERALWLAPTFATFVLALLSKTIAVTLPFVLVLFDYLEGRGFREGRLRVFREKAPFFALSVLFAAISIIVHKPQEVIEAWPEMTHFNRVLVAIKSIVFYLYKTVAPLRLAAIYPYPEGITILKPEYFLAVIFIAALLAIISL